MLYLEKNNNKIENLLTKQTNRIIAIDINKFSIE